MSKNELEVDKAKSEVIKHLPLSNNLRQFRGSLAIQLLIKDFTKIFEPLINLPSKNISLIINVETIKAFN